MTTFLSVILASIFIVSFALQHRKRKLGSFEQEALKPLREDQEQKQA